MFHMKATDFGKVAVLLGGRSAEREISLLSGNAVLAALKRQDGDAHAFDPGGIPTPRYALLEAGSDYPAVVKELGLPLIVKPGREGSTIGLSKVAEAKRL